LTSIAPSGPKEGRWTTKTTFENKVIFNLFLEIVNDIPIKLLGHEQGRVYASLLQQLPPRRKLDPRYRDLSLEELLKTRPGKTMSVSSVNRHLGVITSFLNWAIKQGYITSNVVEGKTLKQTIRPDRQRKAFSDEDLRLIFSHKKRGLHSYCQWLPLLALYTGARIEELCSLYVSDIRQESEIWVFDFNTQHGRRLKNKYSERIVPVHAKLIDRGFLDYCLKRGQSKRVFLELAKREDIFSADASRWFGRYRHRIGITDERKTFHSFRHTVIDHLKQKLVEPHLIASLVGHAGGSITLDRYGKPYQAGLWPF
jgi:integrase